MEVLDDRENVQDGQRSRARCGPSTERLKRFNLTVS
jgi:hypothetical protein